MQTAYTMPLTFADYELTLNYDTYKVLFLRDDARKQLYVYLRNSVHWNDMPVLNVIEGFFLYKAVFETKTVTLNDDQKLYVSFAKDSKFAITRLHKLEGYPEPHSKPFLPASHMAEMVEIDFHYDFLNCAKEQLHKTDTLLFYRIPYAAMAAKHYVCS
jgi:hypothetical protein